MNANQSQRSLAERRVSSPDRRRVPDRRRPRWLASRRRRAAARGRWMSPRWNLVAALAALSVVAVTIEALPTIGVPASAATTPPRDDAASPDTRSLAERVALFPVLQAEAALDAADEGARPAAGARRARSRIWTIHSQGEPR